jgi:hypothetical protein
MATISQSQSRGKLKDPKNTLGSAGMQTLRDVTKPKGDMAQNQRLENLTNQVEAMAGVFNEANKARLEHRKMMEERHQEVLRRIQSVRTYCNTESQRLDRQVCSFRDKFEHDLERLTNDMLQKLDNKVTAINGKIELQEQRVLELEAGLAQEKEERFRQTEEILGLIKKQVDQLSDGLAKETKIRQAREQEITKQIVAYKDEVDVTIDKEKSKQEQICMSIKRTAELEQERLARRQETIAKTAHLDIQKQQAAIEYETATRISCQDSVVDNVSSFIQRFQDNIREEGQAGN